MSDAFDVTVVLSTCNRAALLGPALASLLAQEPPRPTFEVVVIDNNSSDGTRAVVERVAASADVPVHYVFEPRQGLSHARNAGVDIARAELIAFTDDDVRVSPTWVRVIRDTFAAHPDVQCLGGRTLPVWPAAPPKWLTTLHWVGPLALQDYGETPRIIDATQPLCLAGANFAFRKGVFDRIGRFSIDFPRAQDTELLLRMYRAGYSALYVPEMLIHAPVAAERLRKSYHRRWHSAIGRYNARMRFEELADPILGLRTAVPNFRRINGVPVFAVRQFVGELWQWVVDSVRGRSAEAFLHETRARALVSYMREARALARPEASTPSMVTPRSEP
jgi:glycosyltransferase involved in cell wall biosynthesis